MLLSFCMQRQLQHFPMITLPTLNGAMTEYSAPTIPKICGGGNVRRFGRHFAPSLEIQMSEQLGALFILTHRSRSNPTLMKTIIDDAGLRTRTHDANAAIFVSSTLRDVCMIGLLALTSICMSDQAFAQSGPSFFVLDTFTGIVNGSGPSSNLIKGTDGRLYGTTLYGAAGGEASFAQGYGTAFAVNLDGTGLTTIYTFTGGNDGAHPQGTLIQGTDGQLYGTTVRGGANGYGTVFAVNLGGTGFTTVYTFKGGNNP